MEEDRPVQDADLVESILGGDIERYATLVERYQRMVASVAWRYGVQRDEVEDLTHEVFIKAFRNLRRYRPEHPFSTWLYRLAANHVIDHGRRARREAARAEMPVALVDDAPGPGERLELDERREVVRQALNDVAPRYREALFLVYVEGFKVDEAARALGLPSGTVKTRLMRGRESLRKILVRRHPGRFEGGDTR